MEIKWTPDLATGIEIIDNQHKDLISRIDNLFQAMKVGKGRDEIYEMIEFLEKYVVEHFSTEEKYMKKYHYDELKFKLHLTQHKRFVQQLKDLREEFDEKGASSYLAIKIHKHVLTWLLSHIKRVDLEYASFLRDKIK